MNVSEFKKKLNCLISDFEESNKCIVDSIKYHPDLHETLEHDMVIKRNININIR